MRIVVTAAYDRSVAAIVLCEMLSRSGHEIVGVLVTTPLSWQRVRFYYQRLGLSGLLVAWAKLRGLGQRSTSDSPLMRLLINQSIEDRSLRGWCKSNGPEYVSSGGPNSDKAVSWLGRAAPDVVVYAGGGILKSPFISAVDGKIVNPHSGPLPQVRGMNAIEWALLLDQPLQATVHCIDEGIDSGPILGRFEVKLSPDESMESLREKAVVAGIQGIVDILGGVNSLEEVSQEPNVPPQGSRQCFVMAPSIKQLAEHKLARRVRALSA